ncbi:MAG: AGE family epimerase/isomerase [Firmicutes bacterium]|nr:AGE family epimerase/isomerase [Bacillota bacterium]
MAEIARMAAEAKEHLLGKIVPFWRSLRDDTYGGWYGYVSYDLNTDREAVKGCILNSRITWFFSNVYLCCKEGLITAKDCLQYGYSPEDIRSEAEHGYQFLKKHCLDRENGGIYWSLQADGTPEDDTKHTYNQAFCIYALSSYYEALGDRGALQTAFELFDLIEGKCTDEVGYLEAFTVDFKPASNEKLSENGVMAAKTMNTLLHVFEAYTQLYKVSGNERVGKRLEWILDTFADKIYDPEKHRQEVFFDENYHSIIDLHSYGHDIETAWLIDLGLDVLGDPAYEKKLAPITKDLTAQIYKTAFNGHSLANECEKGTVNTHRIWWVQAESVIGFLNGYQKEGSHREYLKAALNQWKFILEYVVDSRSGSEWFWEVDEEGTPYPDRPIVEPWKCPYHNGRMCMEILKRARELAEGDTAPEAEA